jgi:hypothetical protein
MPIPPVLLPPPANNPERDRSPTGTGPRPPPISSLAHPRPGRHSADNDGRLRLGTVVIRPRLGSAGRARAGSHRSRRVRASRRRRTVRIEIRAGPISAAGWTPGFRSGLPLSGWERDQAWPDGLVGDRASCSSQVAHKSTLPVRGALKNGEETRRVQHVSCDASRGRAPCSYLG